MSFKASFKGHEYIITFDYIKDSGYIDVGCVGPDVYAGKIYESKDFVFLSHPSDVYKFALYACKMEYHVNIFEIGNSIAVEISAQLGPFTEVISVELKLVAESNYKYQILTLVEANEKLTNEVKCLKESEKSLNEQVKRLEKKLLENASTSYNIKLSEMNESLRKQIDSLKASEKYLSKD